MNAAANNVARQIKEGNCGTHLKDVLSSRKTYLFRPATDNCASSLRRTMRSQMTTSFFT